MKALRAMLLYDHSKVERLDRANRYLRRTVEWYEREVEDLREELAATKKELNHERARYLRICND